MCEGLEEVMKQFTETKNLLSLETKRRPTLNSWWSKYMQEIMLLLLEEGLSYAQNCWNTNICIEVLTECKYKSK